MSIIRIISNSTMIWKVFGIAWGMVRITGADDFLIRIYTARDELSFLVKSMLTGGEGSGSKTSRRCNKMRQDLHWMGFAKYCGRCRDYALPKVASPWVVLGLERIYSAGLQKHPVGAVALLTPFLHSRHQMRLSLTPCQLYLTSIF